MKYLPILLLSLASSTALAAQPADSQAGFQLKYSTEYAKWAGAQIAAHCLIDGNPLSKVNLQIVEISSDSSKAIFFASQHAICPGEVVTSFSGVVTFMLDGHGSVSGISVDLKD